MDGRAQIYVQNGEVKKKMRIWNKRFDDVRMEKNALSKYIKMNLVVIGDEKRDMQVKKKYT